MPNTKMLVENLANTYRPQLLSDLVGQDHIVTEIKGMLTRKRFSNTLLLNGPTGCGKTTIARLIARYLSCSKPDQKTHDPCGSCMSCKYSDSHPDVAEINMADSRGVDDVRALIQSAQAMPTLGAYRLFIVDEVHALTSVAAQCLLKALEEPPARTIWILATTNPEKLPATILGRCNKLQVKQIDPITMAKRLFAVAKQEGCDLKSIEGYKELLKTIADLSGGHMRDALSLLEKLLAALASDKNIDHKLLMSEYLKTSDSDAEADSATLLAALLASDLKQMLTVVRKSSSVRTLLSKCRWLIQYQIDNSIGLAKYTPYGAKLFAAEARKQNLTVKISTCVDIQYLLLDIETKFNTLNLDEQVIMLSMLGNFINETRRARA